jgi:hypothetical protein
MNELVDPLAISKIKPPTIDYRLAFLECASARLFLVNIGEMDLGEAFDGLVYRLRCPCERETIERWERDFPPAKQGRR